MVGHKAKGIDRVVVFLFEIEEFFKEELIIGFS